MLRICLARRVLLACLSGTRPNAHRRLFAGHEQTRSARAPPARRDLLAGCSASRHWTRSSYQPCRTPRFPGLCDAGFTPLPAGSISPRLHPATRLCRFSLLFSGSSARVQFFFVTLCKLLLDGLSSQDAALPPTDSGSSAFGGLNHLEGFLPLPSEGYNISKARTSSMPDFPFLRKFPLCVCTVFVFFLLNVLAHILIFGSVQHLYASYIYVLCLPAPPPFFYCISFLRISLFSSHVHPYVLSIWRAISLMRAPSSSFFF